MRVVVNGESQEVQDGLTVAELVVALGVGERIALERNRVLVRRVDWPRVAVCAEDQYEIVQFVGGGCGGRLRSRSATGMARGRVPVASR